MRSIKMRVALAALVTCFLAVSGAQQLVGQRHTPVTMMRLYTGPDGNTHVEEIDVKLTPNTQFYDRSETARATSLQFRRWSPGYVNDWHTAPQRQYVITLGGQGEIELTGGQIISAQPGSVLLAEDTTGKGHITRTVGKEDWITVAVPLADK